MPFLQFTIDLAGLDADEVESACFAAGALSITLSDTQDEPILEPALGTTPLWAHTRLIALFPAQANQDEVIAALETSVPASALTVDRLEDRIWEREWLKDFHPMRFGQRLWVCPHGQSAPDPDAVIVYLDPGLAFGTGTHPTTALCLEWLDTTALDGRTVIDYGCGSGILAIAAVKLGARSAVGVDLDPQALLATRDNAIRNDVSDRIVTVAPGKTDYPPVDLLIANILATPLIELASVFAPLVKSGGRIALSGILSEQSQAVTEAYAPWFDMSRFASREGTSREHWVCLHGTRR